MANRHQQCIDASSAFYLRALSTFFHTVGSPGYAEIGPHPRNIGILYPQLAFGPLFVAKPAILFANRHQQCVDASSLCFSFKGTFGLLSHRGEPRICRNWAAPPGIEAYWTHYSHLNAFWSLTSCPKG